MDDGTLDTQQDLETVILTLVSVLHDWNRQKNSHTLLIIVSNSIFSPFSSKTFIAMASLQFQFICAPSAKLNIDQTIKVTS